MTACLHIHHLSIYAGQHALVRNINLNLSAGEPLTLLGESGSGKSLVMHAIMGSLPSDLHTEGKILLQLAGQKAQNLLALPSSQRQALWGRAFSLLPQEPWLALDPTMPVLNQLQEVYQQVRGLSPPTSRQHALAQLQKFGLQAPEQVPARYPFQLSGGMCQRVAIAMADAAQANVLLADEPTKGLDETLRDSVAQQLRHQVAQQRLLFTITHDLQLAKSLGGTVGIMRRGELVEVEPAAKLFTQAQHPYSQRLLAADPTSWPPRQAAHSKTSSPLLTGHGLSKRIKTRTLFSNLNVHLKAGQMTALFGPSGCGKTTLGNILLGLDKADAGHVARATGLQPLQMQKLYQDPPSAFAPHLTLAQGLADLQHRHRIAPQILPDLLEQLDLSPALLTRRPNAISGGELQRIALARALMLSPKLLFADEATSRLDPINQQHIMRLLRHLCDETDMAVLMVSHEPHLIAHYTDQIVSLCAIAS